MPATSSTSFQIRPIEPQDDETMARIIRRVMPEFGCVGEGYSINDPEVDQLYENYRAEGYAFFVLETAGTVVGGAGIAPLAGGDGTTCELRKMYFLPEVRGHGFGRKLLQTCLDRARQMGYHTCYLETVSRMETAGKLYQSFGFRPLSGPAGNTGHNSCDAWYELSLV